MISNAYILTAAHCLDGKAVTPNSLAKYGCNDVATATGTNCIKIGLPGKLILSKRKGLWEVLFS